MEAAQASTSKLDPVRGKRPRETQSCAQCRRLKLKCNRVWPCTNCVRRGFDDACPHETARPASRATRAATDIARLLEREQELLDLLHRIDPTLVVPARADIESEVGVLEVKKLEKRRGGPSGGVEVVAGVEKDTLVAAVGSLRLAEDGSARYLGVSVGSAYFTDDEEEDADDDGPAYDSASQMNGQDSPIDIPGQTTPSAFPFGLDGSTAADDREAIERLRQHLPPYVEALRLAGQYFTYVAMMFEPVSFAELHEDHLVAAYTPGDPSGPKLALVFTVLALGSLFDPTMPARGNKVAAAFFRKGQAALTASKFLRIATVPGIQALHASGNYYFNQPALQRQGESFFPLLGIAVKQAITCGLHRDGASWGLPEAESNRRRLVFHELIVLDRLQALITGRPYSVQDAHFDTLFPTDASAYQVSKWKLGSLIAQTIDKVFSARTTSTYAAIKDLTAELGVLYRSTAEEVRSGALPPAAFAEKPADERGVLAFPAEAAKVPAKALGDLRSEMQSHTLSMMFVATLLYMHKLPFARALEKYPAEPLQSPWAASVSTVVLEAVPYVVRIAAVWTNLNPALTTRWWHVYYHLFSASTAASSFIVQSPGSMLASYAWKQLNTAHDIFVTASATDPPIAMLLPRVRVLRLNAASSLSDLLGVPHGVSTRDEHADRSLSHLGATTQILQKRSSKHRDTGVNEPVSPLATSPPAVDPRAPWPAALDAQAAQLSAAQFGFPPVPSASSSPLGGNFFAPDYVGANMYTALAEPTWAQQTAGYGQGQEQLWAPFNFDL